MKLNKRLKQFEDTNLRNSQNATNSDNSCFCEVENYGVLSKDLTPSRYTLKVLATNVANMDVNTKSKSCAHEENLQIESIHRSNLDHNNESSLQSLKPAYSNR